MLNEYRVHLHIYGIGNCDSCRHTIRWLETRPLPLLLANPTLIKRPVITDGKTILDIGFSPAHLEDYI